jgi:hypothetical protein
MAGNKVTCTNRDVWDAHGALAALVNQGWPDARTGFQVAKTFRNVRNAQESIEETRTMLLKEYAVTAEDGGYAKDVDGTIRLSDPAVFNDEWRALLVKEVELEVFPVPMSALLDGKKSKCSKCGRSNIHVTPVQLEVLAHIGALLDDTHDTEIDNKSEEGEEE